MVGKPKVKALTGGSKGPKALATKVKRAGVTKKEKSSPLSSGKKKGKKEKGAKKGKGKRKKRKKKGPRCPIKRRRKALKRKCVSMTDAQALLNSYYTNHGVVELLKFRKFKWKKKKKET